MKNIKIAFIICCAVLLLQSCDDDFLNLTPPDKIPAEGYISTPERAQEAVNAIYVSFQEDALFGSGLSKLLDAPAGDIALTNTTGEGLGSFTYAASDGIISGAYSKLYQAVYRANVAIEEIPLIEMDQALKDRYIGEAKFLRAFAYWHLTTLWGDVILLTEPFEKTSDVLIAKSPRADVYAVMYDDLTFAASGTVLPTSYADANDLGRVTRGAAQALLGKVYLYDENYSEAESWFNKVITSGVYDLMDDFGKVVHLDYENNIESVFEIQYSILKGTGRIQSQNPGVVGGWNNTHPTQKLVDEFEENDPRLGLTVFLEGEEYAPHLTTETVNLDTYNSDWSATGYNIKKGMFPVKNVEHNAINFPAIRYADVLLMYAEAANEEGNIDDARDAVNEVRARVDMPLLTEVNTGTKETMFDAIVHERMVELAFETHRYPDILRWGLTSELNENYSEKYRYYPLPQGEIDINPELVQRTGW